MENPNLDIYVHNNFFYFFFMFLKEVSSARQDSIYLIENTVQFVKYYSNVKQLFSMWICVKL